jgi:hypothetical protein
MRQHAAQLGVQRGGPRCRRQVGCWCCRS